MYYPIYVDIETKKVSLQKSKTYSAEVFPKLSDGSDGRWRWGRDTTADRLDELIAAQVGADERWDIFQLDYAENEDGVKRIKPKTVWIGSEFSNESGTLEIKKLLGKGVFDTPKPTGLIKYLCAQSLDDGDIVLDFFAGSGTTAHSILELNYEEPGNRKFILVQLPEQIYSENKNQKIAYDFCKTNKLRENFAEITKERVRRVIQKMNDEEAGQLPFTNHPQDRGFRVFKLAESNFKAWEASAPKDTKSLAKQLELHVEHIREGRSSEDILYEILFKSGYPLTVPIQKHKIEKKTVYGVQDNAMLICLDKKLTLELIRAMAELKPQRIVCLDLGFAGNDQLKTNAVQIFKNKEIVFKTV